MTAMLQDSYPASQHKDSRVLAMRRPKTRASTSTIRHLCRPNRQRGASHHAAATLRPMRPSPLALRHAEKPEYFLSTIQVGITLLMLVTGAVAGDALGTHIATLLHGGRAAWLEPYARVLGVVLGFALISFIQIVVGELVPKRLALSAPEKVSVIVAIPMLLLSRATAPFVWLLNPASSLLLLLLGVRSRGHAAATEEEIRLLVAESAEQGVLDADEHNMVNRVLRL